VEAERPPAGLQPARAARLLVIVGAAGALLAAGLVLGDLGFGAAGRPFELLAALLLTIPLAVGLNGILRPQAEASGQAKGFAALGLLLWLAGIGGDVFNPNTEAAGFLPGFHASALVGAVALAGAGLVFGKAPANRAERRRAARRRVEAERPPAGREAETRSER
jgi:hypothetical protein